MEVPMLDCYTTQLPDLLVIPIKLFVKEHFQQWLSGQAGLIQRWVNHTGYEAKPGSICLIPNSEGGIQEVLYGFNEHDFNSLRELPNLLPPNVYEFLATPSFGNQTQEWSLASILWGLGCYQFDRYSEQVSRKPKLLLSHSVDNQFLNHLMTSLWQVCDWINTPAEDMGPAELADVVVTIGKKFNSKISILRGDQLLKKGYPAVHAVGRSSSREPHFVDLRWGKDNAPKLTLVGKGICFDSGGLDLKTADGMRLMKKDMAGAAHALGLAQLIMMQELPFYIRLLIPAADNVVSGSSYRPGDIINTRAGKRVEIGNTDAEGRLVLCDALAEGVKENPAYLIDFSTLTGAAKVALGPNIPALFCNHDVIANRMLEAATRVKDPLWRMPLYQPYCDYLKSGIADLCNASKYPYGGAITAALFLQAFVPNHIPWAHIDMAAWNLVTGLGRPDSAEVMALRAVYEFLAMDV